MAAVLVKEEEFKGERAMSAVLYDKFEMPKRIKVVESEETATFARFIAEPFERGFGHTLGNSLRRMLLTAIEAPAILSFFMEGVRHEYMAVDGIVEDVTNIILNLKGALLRRVPTADVPHIRERKAITKILDITQSDLGEKGEYVVTLGDLISSSEFEVVNPELSIFTVTKPMTRRVELKVGFGRGYVPAERIEVENRIVDEIIIDAIFSPVRLVNYYVEDTRVGQDTDFDRLILEVTTDGRITPREALAFSSKILIKHLNTFENMDSRMLSFEEPLALVDSDRDELMQKLALGINEIELSVRSANCLNLANINTIGELVVMPEPELLKFRNFGKKSLNEIKAKLSEMGLSLGMNLEKFGINDRNVKEKIKEYLEEESEPVL
jgi:DNA-directed RNA polymerase subunit alpha